MLTNHVDSVGEVKHRPKTLPVMTPDMLCKAKYRDGEQLCYTGWLLELFLKEGKEYPAAYKQFRLKTMDVLYGRHSEDHANTAEERSAVFNEVAQALGYRQVRHVAKWVEEFLATKGMERLLKDLVESLDGFDQPYEIKLKKRLFAANSEYMERNLPERVSPGRTRCNSCGTRGIDGGFGQACTACDAGTWVSDRPGDDKGKPEQYRDYSYEL